MARLLNPRDSWFWLFGTCLNHPASAFRHPLFLSGGESTMAPDISLTEFLDQAIVTFKRNINDMITNVISCKAIKDLQLRQENVFGNGSFQGIMETIGSHCQLTSDEWLPNKKEDDNRGNSNEVFNVLDAMLRESLERLKSMRESTSTVIFDLDKVVSVGIREHSSTIRNFCLGGKWGAALLLRRKMMLNGFVPDVFTHNHIVNALCRRGELGLDMADVLISEMLKRGPPPNCATFNAFIKGYCLVNRFDKAFIIFSAMADKGVVPNMITYNILVHALCKEGQIAKAKKLFDQILADNEAAKTDLITSTIFMDGYFKSRDFFRALAIWDSMLENKVQMDVVAYTVRIQGAEEMKLAYCYSCEMFKRGILPDVFTYNTIISGLCKRGKVDEACYIQRVMLKVGVLPDHISIKMILRGLCLRDVYKAKEYLDFMLEQSVVPEPIVWNLVVDGFVRLGDLDNAYHLIDRMLSMGVAPNVYTYNALILGHVKNGGINRAYTLRKEMVSKGIDPDVVTYNLLIGAVCNAGDVSDALQLCSEMRRFHLKPDTITYTELIKACCISGDLNAARGILFYLLQQSRLPVDHVPFQILIKHCSKMRQLDMAFDLYKIWSERNLGVLPLP